MRALCFLDTNVLLYAAAGQKDDPGKAGIAVNIIREERISVSSQVIGEFYQNARRKFHTVISLAEANDWVDRLFRLRCADVDQALVKSAMFIAERLKIAFWDAALIAASERLEASVLYTEDLSHGQRYGTVTVINPFKGH